MSAVTENPLFDQFKRLLFYRIEATVSGVNEREIDDIVEDKFGQEGIDYLADWLEYHFHFKILDRNPLNGNIYRKRMRQEDDDRIQNIKPNKYL